MGSRDEWFAKLASITRLSGMDEGTAVRLVAQLADLASELGRPDGLELSIRLLDELLERDLGAEQRVHASYSKGTALADLRAMSVRQGEELGWDDPLLAQSILALRQAWASADESMPSELLCRLLTNLGNQLDHVGRFVEAIDYWDRALESDPYFTMAIGNKGMALWRYASVAYDRGHAAALGYHAYRCLQLAQSLGAPEHAAPTFARWAQRISDVLAAEFLEQPEIFPRYPTGGSKEEALYRGWCLRNRLFINPLNDLGHYEIAATDVMGMPPIVADLGEGPQFHGLFNQLKQEYVSARYLCYEGRAEHRQDRCHYSDRDTHLVNTLDYPSYSLAAEMQKAAFRMAYSLFDKIAFFLNAYFRLGIPEKKVGFKRLWYSDGNRNRGLRHEFTSTRNLPLRALFWLAKDLFDGHAGFRDALEPDAQQIEEIRHELEHKYLKLHWLDSGKRGRSKASELTHDSLAYYLDHGLFNAKALRVLRMARAALIYLSAAVHIEERRRRAARGLDVVTPPIQLDLFDDEWKR